MKTIFTLLTSTLALGALSLSPTASHAGDTVKLESHESNGYFDKFGRVGLFYGMMSGELPRTPDTKTFKRNGFGVEFDMLGFWDATRFDTLLGAEFKTVFGSYSASKIDGEPDSASDKNYLMFRMDAASDYGLLHWDGPIKGRVSGGGGFGFDLDGGKWYASKGRAYAQLLGRVQLWVGNIGLHAAYHWVPGTLSNDFIREHRFEGAAALGAFQGGLRLIVTTVHLNNTDSKFISQEGQIFAAYAF